MQANPLGAFSRKELVMERDSRDVARFAEGRYRPHALNAKLAQIWPLVLQTPQRRAQISEILGVEETWLEGKPAPLTFEVRSAGLTGAEIALVAATWVLIDPVKDIVKEAMKIKIKQLWTDVIAPALRHELPDRDALGDERPLEKR